MAYTIRFYNNGDGNSISLNGRLGVGWGWGGFFLNCFQLERCLVHRAPQSLAVNHLKPPELKQFNSK